MNEVQREFCSTCDYRRRVGHKWHGKRIPDGSGKCTRPGGFCQAKRELLEAGSPNVPAHLPGKEIDHE